MKLELFYPVDQIIITQPFGVNGEFYREHGINIAGHNGIDFFTAHGALIRAAHNGTVVYAGMDANEGVGVVIRTDEPREFNGGEFYAKTIYWHLINNIPVRVGQKVKVGDVVMVQMGVVMKILSDEEAKASREAWEEVENRNSSK